MPEPIRTQKQIAERFRGTLDYFKQPHYLRRARLWVSLVCFVAGVTAIAVYHHTGPAAFYSSGPLSAQHAQLTGNCAACHDSASLHGDGFERAAAIDQACQKCHTSHTLHAPNVPFTASCTACHHEHLGAGPMRAVSDQRCADCHGREEVMLAAGRRAAALPEELFVRQTLHGLRVFTPPRPAGGRTNVFQSFADHPEFQVVAERLREPNTLRFNHRRHVAADIPEIEGRRLDCAFCHVPDASGHFFQRISFEQHCRVCHSLNFDPLAPALEIPHGDPGHVRAFLRSLPAQYAQHARQLGRTGEAGQDAFVREAVAGLRTRFGSGEELERQVFLSNHSGRPAPDGGVLPARIMGCAYCHQVSANGEELPVVVVPQIPDRWLSQGSFNHATHAGVACADCHAVKDSVETAEVLLPSKTTCLSCHGPAGRAGDSCAVCHSYHARPEPMVTAEWLRLLREGPGGP